MQMVGLSRQTGFTYRDRVMNSSVAGVLQREHSGGPKTPKRGSEAIRPTKLLFVFAVIIVVVSRPTVISVVVVPITLVLVFVASGPPVPGITLHHARVMLRRRIVEIHPHRWRHQQDVDRDARRGWTRDPVAAVPINVAVPVAAVINLIAWI